jgi:hypothetical protein
LKWTNRENFPENLKGEVHVTLALFVLDTFSAGLEDMLDWASKWPTRAKVTG